ncbi:hypothetical protein IU487_22490 [Nocardia puris]|uniref:hypothetical protein n=1 Tax=Nocardia puris TaxID=208602 RepID=UPI001894F69D|nr:hypothetical protein [Nocardia puris]MBF6213790.1 hypothetical protein [Nocardia puris]
MLLFAFGGQSFAPSGMLKDGSTYSVPASFTEIPGWVANTGTYPGSALSGNGLLVQGGKADATITATIGLSNGFSLSTQVRILKNGNVIVTGSATTGTTATASISGHAVADGDVITVQIMAGSAGFVTVVANTPSLTIV